MGMITVSIAQSIKNQFSTQPIFNLLPIRWVLLVLIGLMPLFSVSETMTQDVIDNQTKACLIQDQECELERAWLETRLNSTNKKVVNFFAWGGDPNINAYLKWAAEQLFVRYGIEFNHIKLSSTTEAVTLIIAEGNKPNVTPNGSVDLIWINGENFSLLQESNLLLGQWVSDLPNFKWLNSDNRPHLLKDFGLKTQGYEAPWGQANLVFFYNQKHIKEETLPNTPEALLNFTQTYPGRFTYPKPTDFVGVSFLKQTLAQLSPEETRFYEPIERETFNSLTQPLWEYLDKLHPNLYRKGHYFIASNTAILRLFDDELILLGLTFSPNSIIGAKLRFDLPETVRLHAMQSGSLSNVHFLAIPAFATHSDAAQVAVNFLLSPEAQAYKANATIWGDQTVLDVPFFSSEIGAAFNQSTEPSLVVEHPLEEFHPSWNSALIEAWKIRYEQDSPRGSVDE